ncbi:MAG TPA: efflux RND transporter periplasmic adaptor subunit, partial [Bacteroidales bacterium]|nr:efflux RND transporter periplasmic adaptor subunit [Bacteroidales bacterium]
ERFFHQLRRGLSAQITSDLFPGRTFTGRVDKIHPTIDRVTGTFRAEVVVENSDMALRPGMFTRVSINLGQVEALLVPALAVLKQVGSNERFVFVEENGIAHRKTVAVGRNIDDKQEILSGLEPGQNLVVAGQHNLIHLRIVQVQN